MRISLVDQGGAPFVPRLNLCVIVCSFCVSPRAAVAAVVVQVERLDLRRRVELASRAEARKEVSQGILESRLNLHYLHLHIYRSYIGALRTDLVLLLRNDVNDRVDPH